MTTERERKKSSSESPPLSFSSLPYDVILNCLARVSRIHYPTLCLVSKDLRSLITSTELDTTRSHIGKTESFTYVCLDLNKNNPNPSWFTSPNPKQHLKFQPITSFPYTHPKSPTFCSFGSEIYIIGGFINRTRSSTVFILDCRCHQWRRLPEMRLSRVKAAADVIDGKLYVVGGAESNDIEDWGEVYDLKTQTWKPLLPRELDHTNHMRVVQGSLVMSGKVYNMDGLKLELKNNLCLVEINMNMSCLITFSRNLIWRDPNEGSKWRIVKLIWRDSNENLKSPYSYFKNKSLFVTNSGGGKRSVMLWWKTFVCVHQGGWMRPKTAISCAEVSFERRSLREIWGFVEWCKKNVVLLDGLDYSPDFFFHYACVTH